MSKKIIGQQLDLFGNSFSPQEEKKEEFFIESTESVKNDFVFLDEKIGVKIKLKPNQEKAIVTESKAVYKQEKTKSKSRVLQYCKN